MGYLLCRTGQWDESAFIAWGGLAHDVTPNLSSKASILPPSLRARNPFLSWETLRESKLGKFKRDFIVKH